MKASRIYRTILIFFVALPMLFGCDTMSGNNSSGSNPTAGVGADSVKSDATVVMLNRRVSPSEVASIANESDSLTVEHIRYYGGGMHGSFGNWEKYSATTIDDKMNAFKRWVGEAIEKSRKHTRSKIKERTGGGISKAEFASSPKLQKVGISIKTRIEQQNKLKSKVSSGGRVIYSVVVNGSEESLESLKEREVVSGSADLSDGVEEAKKLQPPQEILNRDKEKAKSIKSKLAKVKAVSAKSGSEIPKKTKNMYDDISRSIEQAYGINVTK